MEYMYCTLYNTNTTTFNQMQMTNIETNNTQYQKPKKEGLKIKLECDTNPPILSQDWIYWIYCRCWYEESNTKSTRRSRIAAKAVCVLELIRCLVQCNATTAAANMEVATASWWWVLSRYLCTFKVT